LTPFAFRSEFRQKKGKKTNELGDIRADIYEARKRR
jgi:hypothetical protein